jgi:hypothetical protein
MSSTGFSLVATHLPARRGTPALRVRQDPQQPQRLRLSGSFGEVCRALDALSQSEPSVEDGAYAFSRLAH